MPTNPKRGRRRGGVRTGAQRKAQHDSRSQQAELEEALLLAEEEEKERKKNPQDDWIVHGWSTWRGPKLPPEWETKKPRYWHYWFIQYNEHSNDWSLYRSRAKRGSADWSTTAKGTFRSFREAELAVPKGDAKYWITKRENKEYYPFLFESSRESKKKKNPLPTHVARSFKYFEGEILKRPSREMGPWGLFDVIARLAYPNRYGRPGQDVRKMWMDDGYTQRDFITLFNLLKERFPKGFEQYRVEKKREGERQRAESSRRHRARLRRNPAKKKPKKSFADKPHDWKEVLISHPGKSMTRKQIRDYYVRNADKIWPFLKGQTVAIIFAAKRNKFIRRRKGPDGKHIKLTKLEGIDDPKSFEYWINRRVIEFHPVLTTKTSPILWLDLDMHKTTRKETRKKLLAKMKRLVPKLKKAFAKMGVSSVHVYDSGTGGGIHLAGSLSKRLNVDKVRHRFRDVLDEMFEADSAITTGRAAAGQIRLDTTTFHHLGSLRAPHSLTVYGGVKRPIGRKRS